MELLALGIIGGLTVTVTLLYRLVYRMLDYRSMRAELTQLRQDHEGDRRVLRYLERMLVLPPREEM